MQQQQDRPLGARGAHGPPHRVQLACAARGHRSPGTHTAVTAIHEAQRQQQQAPTYGGWGVVGVGGWCQWICITSQLCFVLHPTIVVSTPSAIVVAATAAIVVAAATASVVSATAAIVVAGATASVVSATAAIVVAVITAIAVATAAAIVVVSTAAIVVAAITAIVVVAATAVIVVAAATAIVVAATSLNQFQLLIHLPVPITHPPACLS